MSIFIKESIKNSKILDRVNKVIKLIPAVMKAYILYAFILGVMIFSFYRHNVSNYKETHKVDRFLGKGLGQDRVALVEDRYESGLARINLIENAEETLEISYYTIDKGISSEIFWGSIINAADRGVEVRVLLDGIFHNLKGDTKDIIYACYNHPNIQLKFYEPLNIFKPWTWNNRLHDKIIIVDNELAIIGGRNIGDRYFTKDDYDEKVTNDRDVVILNTDKENMSGSVISQMEDYFNETWNYKFSKYPLNRLRKGQKEKGEEKTKYLKNYISKLKKTEEEMFNHAFNWEKISYPTSKITLIHNPIERLNKEPWCWYSIISLGKAAEESVFIQSPYVVPTNKMLKHIDTENDLPEKVDILTNSLATNANPMGTAGTMLRRKDVVDMGINLHEYQGAESIHAKSYIFDDRVSLVGSFNVDARSAYLSTETMVVIDGEEFAEHFKEEIKNQIDQSLMVGKDYSYIEDPNIEARKPPVLKTIITKFLSILAYFFDFMI